MKKTTLIMASTLLMATALLTPAIASGHHNEEPTPREAPSKVKALTVYFRLRLTGRIGNVDNAKMTLRGLTGTLTYRMGGKTVRSTLKVDTKQSRLDNDGFGYLVVNSYDSHGKKKGTFIGEGDVCEAGYIFEGTFHNVNGATTEFIFTE